MGRYLATGLITRISVVREEAERAKLGKDELISRMSKELYFEPELFDYEGTDTRMAFLIKPQIFERDLLPLLERVYSLYFRKDEEARYLDILNKLNAAGPGKYMQLAHEKMGENYQYDEYGEEDYLRSDLPFGKYTHVYYKTILLTLGGKIITESIYKELLFYKHLLHFRLSDIELAKALRIYITG